MPSMLFIACSIVCSVTLLHLRAECASNTVTKSRSLKSASVSDSESMTYATDTVSVTDSVSFATSTITAASESVTYDTETITTSESMTYVTDTVSVTDSVSFATSTISDASESVTYATETITTSRSMTFASVTISESVSTSYATVTDTIVVSESLTFETATISFSDSVSAVSESITFTDWMTSSDTRSVTPSSRFTSLSLPRGARTSPASSTSTPTMTRRPVASGGAGDQLVSLSHSTSASGRQAPDHRVGRRSPTRSVATRTVTVRVVSTAGNTTTAAEEGSAPATTAAGTNESPTTDSGENGPQLTKSKTLDVTLAPAVSTAGPMANATTEGPRTLVPPSLGFTAVLVATLRIPGSAFGLLLRTVRVSLVAAFRADLAQSLNISVAFIHVLEMYEGSLVVSFAIDADAGLGPDEVKESLSMVVATQPAMNHTQTLYSDVANSTLVGAMQLVSVSTASPGTGDGTTTTSFPVVTAPPPPSNGSDTALSASSEEDDEPVVPTAVVVGAVVAVVLCLLVVGAFVIIRLRRDTKPADDDVDDKAPGRVGRQREAVSNPIAASATGLPVAQLDNDGCFTVDAIPIAQARVFDSAPVAASAVQALQWLLELRTPPPNRPDLLQHIPDDDKVRVLLDYIEKCLPIIRSRPAVKDLVRDHGLTDDDIRILFAYKVEKPYPVYRWLNGFLASERRSVDTAILDHVAPAFTMLYRAMEKLPFRTANASRAAIVRNIPALQATFEHYDERLRPGQPLCFWGCSSFSTDAAVINSEAFIGKPEDDAIVYACGALTGVDMEPFKQAGVGNESELLPMCPAMFCVSAVTKIGSKVSVTLEQRDHSASAYVSPHTAVYVGSPVTAPPY